MLRKENADIKNKKDENEKFKNNYYLLVNEFNKLKTYYKQLYEQAENLIKENEKLKHPDKNQDEYKQNYERINELFNKEKSRNIKLQSELEKIKQLIEEKKEKCKNYKIESLTLDYLRPYDFSDVQKKYGNYENIINKPIIKNNIINKEE